MLISDRTYIKSKNIKQGRFKVELEFQYLKDYLLENFNVRLLNGDIYHEPIFKSLPTKLRLVLEGQNWKERLPIKYEEKKMIIGNRFINIIKENGIDKYGELKYGELDVQYISFDELKFKETKNKVKINAEIKRLLDDRDIIRIQPVYNTYIVFYPNQEILNKKRILRHDQLILSVIIQLLRKEGCKEEYLKQITIRLDEIQSIERAGGWYNYMR